MLVWSHKSHDWAVASRVTLWCMGKLHLQLTGYPEVVKPRPTPFVLDRVPTTRNRKKKLSKWPKPPYHHSIISSTSKIRLPSSRWLVWVVYMELVDEFTSILEVFKRLPAREYVNVSGPVNEVVDISVTMFRVKNPFDLLSFRIIINHWMWFRGWLSYEQQCVMIELRHMEEVVILHCLRQVSFVRILIDDFNYCIWSTALVVELLWRSSRSEVSSWDPHIVPNFEGCVLSSSEFRFPYQGFRQSLPDKPVSLIHARCRCVRLYFRPQISWGFRRLELHWLMEVLFSQDGVIRVEWWTELL